MPEQLDMLDGWQTVDGFYDWEVTERNSVTWHPTFFTEAEVKEHQAKGNMTACKLYIEYMEEQGWLKKGDIILDPMCGIASFLRVAALKGYACFGVELEGKFISLMRDGLDKFRWLTNDVPGVGEIIIRQGDARELEHLDMPLLANAIIGSPPYGNRFTDVGQQMGSRSVSTWAEHDKQRAESKYSQYSESSKNIGNSKIAIITSPPYSVGEHSKKKIDSLPKNDGIAYTGMKPHTYLNPSNIAILKDNAYSREMLKVYQSMYKVLNEGSYVCLITKDFIQKKKVVELHAETIRLMEEAGFALLEHKRTRLPEVSFMVRMNWLKHFKKLGLPLIDWEDATFYIKGEIDNG